ncbi:MAG: S1 RNA-binding domain-containing protein, partial [Acidobacteria bacterium]
MSVDNVKYSSGPERQQCSSVPAQNNDLTGSDPEIHSESPTRLESSPGAEAPDDSQRATEHEPIREEPSTATSEAATPSEPEAAPEASSPPLATETFDESLLDAMEEKAATIRVGETIRGKLIALTEEWALVDIGYKTEGTFPREELQASPEEPAIGSEIYVTVKELEGPNDYVRLSYKDALQKQAWHRVQAAYAEGTPVKGRISQRVKGGFKVNLGGIEAFLPASQLNLFQVRNLDAWVGKEIEAKVLKLNRRQLNIVISRRALLEEEQARRRAEALAQLDEAYIVQGRIKSLTDYGAFVDLGGIDGLLHITDMSWKHIQHPKEMFKVGDIIQVKILKLDREKGRINLGYKQLFPDPWDTIPERYPVGSRVKGKVTRVVNYGAFVELEEGVQGLIHVSEMSWDKRLKHPSKYVKVGDDVLVEVVAIDPVERRLSLSLRRLEPDPWTLFAET